MALSTTQYGYIIDPMVPFTAPDGRTIRNGYAKVFLAGSSTPVITYANFDGTANQERIELDNSGRTATKVIGSKGSTYKVCVYDAEHSQETPILTVDKVSPIGASVNATSVITGIDTVVGTGQATATVAGTTVTIDIPRIKDLTNTAAESDIVSGSYFALDGSAGTKKLNSTTLLTKTAQNALGSVHILTDTLDFPQSGDFAVIDNTTKSQKMDATSVGYSFGGVFVKTPLDFSGTGYVYDTGSGLSTNSDYRYAIVTLQKKCFLVVDVARGGSICAVAAKTGADSVQKFAPLVVGTDSSNNVNRYQYFNETEEDLTVYVSCLASKIPQNCYIASAGQIAQFLSVEKFKDFFQAFDISLIKNIDNTSFDPIEDSYVHVDGSVRSVSGYFIKGPISLPSGYSIKFVTKATNSMAALSIQLSSTSYQMLVRGVGNSAEIYTYRNNTAWTQNVYISCNCNPRALTNGTYFVFKDFVLDRILPVEKRLDEKTLDEEVSIAFFNKVGVVGDSLASGFCYNSQGQSQGNNYSISWPQILGRKSGCTWINYSQGGMNTRSFLTNASYGLPKLLSDDPNDLYVLALGINDADITDYIGSITDITSHESYEYYGDTFYGNYGRIIEQILEHAPSAKIVMSLEPYVSKQTKFVNIDNAIKEIAVHYGLPVLDLSQDFFFTSGVYQNMAQSHPTKVGYAGMANGYERLICKAMVENLVYFNSFVEP